MLLNNGAVIVIYMLNNSKTKQLIKPIITSRGTFYVKENAKMLYELRIELFNDIARELKKQSSQNTIDERILNITSGFIHKRKRRNPLVVPVRLVS